MMIREMTIDDHAAMIALLSETPGVSVREADSREATARYLARNPGLSFVAVVDGALVGCCMAGHDGRRGCLQHLAVAPEYRHQGIGAQLAEACVRALGEQGIAKTHLFVFRTNEAGNQFWQRLGWQLRDDINMYSHNSSANANV